MESAVIKIDKPGLYDLNMATYHDDCCDGPSVSATVLARTLAECPAKVWETSPLNPSRVEEKSKPDFDIGRAAHALVLGEPEFNAHFVVAPYDDFRTKEAREWKAAEKRTVIKADVFENILAMTNAQKRSPQVARAFVEGKPEQSLVWLDAETGIWLKSRPDWLPNDPKARPAVDYKTCRSIEPRKMGMDAFAYGYHIQAALIVDGARAVLGVEPLGVAHVCQEKTIPYLAELRMFDADQLEFGRREYRRALRIFAECWHHHKLGFPERNAWPGYTAKPEYFQTPYHILKQMESQPNAPASKTGTDDYAAAISGGDVPREFYDADAFDNLDNAPWNG